MATHNYNLVKRDARTRAKLEKLARLLKGKSNLLIVMQDNPDPDSIAAAVALRKLANTLAQVHCSIAHGGTVGRGENRALVHYLNLNLRPFDRIELERFDLTAMIYDNCIITDIGEITIPDMVGEVADLLLRDDNATWALCYGLFRKKLLLSIRTSDTSKKADVVMRQVVARRGTAGGHDTIAGGQIPLTKGTKTELANIEKAIRRKLLKSLGIEEQHAQSLIKSPTHRPE